MSEQGQPRRTTKGNILSQHQWCILIQAARTVMGLLCGVILLLPRGGQGFEFRKGAVSGSVDTLVTFGASWRIQDRDEALIGIGNGGRASSTNADEGNLNYDPGLIAALINVTQEVELNYRTFGAFVRGNYFYDVVNANKEALSSEAREQVGTRARLLDAFVTGRFAPGRIDLAVRVGRQVISWGEGIFIPNGIDVINPVEPARIRSPGVALRDALLPALAAWTSVSITPHLTVEGFYLFEFDPIDLDACGTYFSTSDVVGKGCNALFLDGTLPEGTPGTVLPRTSDQEARDSGQFGVALRSLVPFLNDTEFGLYFITYHSRLPLFNTIATPSPNSPPETGGYFLAFPEDIRLLGISFNTTWGHTGITLQGEFSTRFNQPLQIASDQVIRAALHQPSQLGPPAPGAARAGFERHMTSQSQVSASKHFGPNNPFGANEWLVLGEVGVMTAFGLPDKNRLTFEATGGRRADAVSWGYVLRSQWTYEGVLGALTLVGSVAFAHDVHGNSRPPGHLLGRSQGSDTTAATHVSPAVGRSRALYALVGGSRGQCAARSRFHRL